MITTLKSNWPTMVLAGLLFAYVFQLTRSSRLNTRIGVNWLVTLVAFTILNFLPWPLPQLTAIVGNGTPLLGLTILITVWLALLVCNNHARISALTVKLKQMDQELALLQERLDRTAAASPPPPVTASDVSLKTLPGALATKSSESTTPARPVQHQEVISVESRSSLPPTFMANAPSPSLASMTARRLLGSAWIALIIYAIGIASGTFAPQGMLGQAISSIYNTLQAEYLH